MADREKVVSLVEDAIEIVEKEAFWTIANGLRDAISMLKEQEKLINVDELREKLGFSDNCENCKQNARYCQYDSHFALMDFCERLDMAIEELKEEE